MKEMLVTFYIKDIVHSEFIPQGQRVSQAYCVEIFQWLRESVCTKRPEIWPIVWIFHHDNAPALCVKQFLTHKSTTEMEHPLYSHNLVPNYFWLFTEIKSALKGRRFQDIEDIRKQVTTALKAVPQQEFQKCFQQWVNG
jgi:hypothetical protein